MLLHTGYRLVLSYTPPKTLPEASSCCRLCAFASRLYVQELMTGLLLLLPPQHWRQAW
jgi:hypothetical protein